MNFVKVLKLLHQFKRAKFHFIWSLFWCVCRCVWEPACVVGNCFYCVNFLDFFLCSLAFSLFLSLTLLLLLLLLLLIIKNSTIIVNGIIILLLLTSRFWSALLLCFHRCRRHHHEIGCRRWRRRHHYRLIIYSFMSGTVYMWSVCAMVRYRIRVKSVIESVIEKESEPSWLCMYVTQVNK